jgi:hypothetical protein
VPDGEQRAGAAYLFVEDADRLAAQWRAAGADVRSPEDTDWGQREAPSLVRTATSSVSAPRSDERQPL